MPEDSGEFQWHVLQVHCEVNPRIHIDRYHCQVTHAIRTVLCDTFPFPSTVLPQKDPRIFAVQYACTNNKDMKSVKRTIKETIQQHNAYRASRYTARITITSVTSEAEKIDAY